MKKLSTLLIAFALVLGLTQCKKKVDTITPSDLGKTVYITVNVGDGDRHIVYPGTGAVVYADGDIIYVGDGSKYLGSLEYGSGKFISLPLLSFITSPHTLQCSLYMASVSHLALVTLSN